VDDALGRITPTTVTDKSSHELALHNTNRWISCAKLVFSLASVEFLLLLLPQGLQVARRSSILCPSKTLLYLSLVIFLPDFPGDLVPQGS
jgi:hypothetical protein